MARRFRKLSFALLLSLVLSSFASTAMADEYRSERAGHPVRILAYLLHPIGFIAENLIFRPAHWLVSHDRLRAFFGHDDY